MLTGDKLETAMCIAKSSKLVSREQDIFVFDKIEDRADAHKQVNALWKKQECALFLTGASLEVILLFHFPLYVCSHPVGILRWGNFLPPSEICGKEDYKMFESKSLTLLLQMEARQITYFKLSEYLYTCERNVLFVTCYNDIYYFRACWNITKANSWI